MDSDCLQKLIGSDKWVAFATTDGDRPRVRMMTVRCYRGGLWTFTSASSAKAKQLGLNNKFEFVAHLAGEGGVSSVRASGWAETIDDTTVRRELAASSPSFGDHWSSFEDPDFMLLKLNIETMEVERGPDTKAERYVLDPQGGLRGSTDTSGTTP